MPLPPALSQTAANLVDAGLSIVGSAGAGAAAQAVKAGAAVSKATFGLSTGQRIIYYDIGQKTLSPSNFDNFGKIADPVERGMAIVAKQGWPRALLPDTGGLSQFGKTIPKGLTPLATGGSGAVLGAVGAINCGCH